MIIEKSNRKIESNSASAAFSIQASGKMFHMVISGLYSNKAQSITREIWSNAYDAHRMSGQADRPFDVTFPTSLNPVFTCRDYGTGLSHEFMMDLYTVLGHSEKENTNEAVGKWGVGRMSPLSYTDSFTIVSIHEGKKSHYVVTTGSDGAPTITPMGSTTTDEPSGLSVSFPVKMSDLSSFQRAARVVSYGFPVRPNVINGDPLPELRSLIQGDGYTFYADTYHEVSGPQARMGCVLYPLDKSYVEDALRYRNIIIDFPIGSLEVTASREQLSYGANDPTAASITKYSRAVLDTIKKDANASIANCKTLFEARFHAQKLVQGTSVVQCDSFVWQGKPLFENTRRIDQELVKPLTFECGISSRKGKKSVSKTWDRLWIFGHTVSAAGNIQLFIEKHAGKHKDVRAAQRVTSHVGTYENFIWVRADDNTDQAELDAFIKTFGDVVSVVHVKDLPDPGPSTKSVKTSVQVKFWYTHNRSYLDYPLTPEEFQKGGLYVETVGDKLVNFKQDPEARFTDLYHLLSPFDERLKQLIRVPKTVLQQFKDAPQWVEVNTLTDKLLMDNEKTIMASITNYEVTTSSFYQKVNALSKRNTVDTSTLPADLLFMLSTFKRSDGTIHNLGEYIEDKKHQSAHKEARDYCKSLSKKYSMINWVSLVDWSDKEMKLSVLDYLQMVDRNVKTSNISNSTPVAA